MRLIALCLAFLASPLGAHEFWLEPLAYQVAPDGRLEAQIVNGQMFTGMVLSYLPQRTAHFAIFSGDTARDVEGRAGDRPGLQADPVGEGLQVVVYQSTASTLTYEEWEKFAGFAVHKDLPVTHDSHAARGLPDAGFAETYTRYSKTLIGVGHGAGADRRTGLETELVALANPYTDDLAEGMPVQLFYRDNVRANQQIEVFDKTADGVVVVSKLRTDGEGIAIVPVTPGHSYMLDAVYLRETDFAETGAAYETLWANLTFAIPGD